MDTVQMLLALATQKGFEKCLCEFTLYIKKSGDEILVVSLYVDDLLVQQKQNEIFISQQKYAKEVLKKFNMEAWKLTATPMNQKEKFLKEDGAKKVDDKLYRSLIGCLMYLTATKPDIMHVASLLSRYMNCASEIHLQAAKRILRYVKGPVDYGIKFSQVENFSLHGYSDSDWAGCADDMRSTSGYCSGIFSWYSKKQEIIA
ncbi:secreted RxLR effector protein 161-like [Ricinus communis]|uniref:secreted RxLR effector protein 161-like n=1 Tax=Ricinus communis TaxID=3988 RepID=UPI00201ADAB3|nr:secreted RxLR effector protein 161-like [Ricinus communis]